MDSTLSIKNASGKTFSLLNESPISNKSTATSFKVTKLTTSMTLPVQPRRKYHCVEPGCNKSFTTSGHLARHNRIHTGEKNFHCLHPGCPSRFSRQDNMMQHYRTHLSQKLRRQHLRQHQQEKKKESPQLYCHSLHSGEDHMSFQPLMTRPRRSVTMPSLPYPPANLSMMMMNQQKVVNRPRRALSTSSTCSSSSSSVGSLSCSPPPLSSSPPSPPVMYYYDHDHAHVLPPTHQHYHHHQHQHQPQYSRYHHNQAHETERQSNKQQQNHEWAPNSQKSLSSLLHLANIVSTFG